MRLSHRWDLHPAPYLVAQTSCAITSMLSSYLERTVSAMYACSLPLSKHKLLGPLSWAAEGATPASPCASGVSVPVPIGVIIVVDPANTMRTTFASYTAHVAWSKVQWINTILIVILHSAFYAQRQRVPRTHVIYDVHIITRIECETGREM